MDFSNLQEALNRIRPQEGLDPWDLTLVGMGIVFFGLIFISASVYFLPKILMFYEKLMVYSKNLFKSKKSAVSEKEIKEIEEREKAEQEQEEMNIAMAIAVAINLEERLKSQKITWERHEGSDSSWKISGRVSQLERHGTMRRL